jgi:hypothetical protein
MRILDEGLQDDRIPKHHRIVPIRLPFKIDCRDFSLWLGRQDPFSPSETTDAPAEWQKSLESFIAAIVRHHSGGAEFNVSDLHAVMKLSSVLLVFDGLDEVADIGRRSDVIEHISKGVSRLDEIAVSLQTVVTSRPAAFANSPGLPEATFRYLTLESITQPLIEQYAQKWIRARGLASREAGEVRRILRDKLDQPHLRELARNPMQLAILLSLIHTRGGSLPDKRTALYDNYVDLFFSRESEKSSIVRDHRDLLIDIHQYLAWVLHAESQTKKERGSVSGDRLRALVKEYLNTEEHDTNLVDSLFAGMVERVVALVSRVEGTYEFEVQPLREYFAARYLYNTAPYSPPGHEQCGTKPDRFDALSRDFYWLNVTRFYAGCYSKGELASLVDRLEELARSDGYRSTSHPQLLSAILLGDWVFAQHPKSMKQVVSMVLSNIGLHCMAFSGGRYRREAPLVLPKQSGNDELVQRCFEILESNPPSDFRRILIEILRANASRGELKIRWQSTAERFSGEALARWVKDGLFLGVIPNLDGAELSSVLNRSHPSDDDCLLTFLRGGHGRFIEETEERFNRVLAAILDTNPPFDTPRQSSVLDSISSLLSPYRYACAFESRNPTPLNVLWRNFERFETLVNSTGGGREQFEADEACLGFVKKALELSERTSAEWAGELTPWTELVECGRKLFGSRWSFCVLANTSAGIRSKVDKHDDVDSLLDDNTPLCPRVRQARLRANAHRWWRDQLEAAIDESQEAFVLLVLLTWAGSTVITKNLDIIDKQLSRMSLRKWLKLSNAIQLGGMRFSQTRSELKISEREIALAVTARTRVALSWRLDNQNSLAIFRDFDQYDGDDPAVLDACQRLAVFAAQETPSSWTESLPVIARCYDKGSSVDRYFGYRFARAVPDMPIEVARDIVSRCDLYPSELVAWAEETCRQAVAWR